MEREVITIRGRAHCAVLQDALASDEKPMCGASLSLVCASMNVGVVYRKTDLREACSFHRGVTLTSETDPSDLSAFVLQHSLRWMATSMSAHMLVGYSMRVFCLLKNCFLSKAFFCKT